MWYMDPYPNADYTLQQIELFIADDFRVAWVDSAFFTLNEWHLITAYTRGDEIGIVVDNGPAATESFVSYAVPGSTGELRVMGTGGPAGFLIDELTLWKDYGFSPTDLNQDWNNGNGRTWPW